MKLRELIIKIGADTQDYDRKLAKATSQIKKFGEDAADVGQRLSIGITLPLAAVGAAALKAAGELEQNRIAFTTMMKSAEGAQKHLDALKQFALATPFQFTDLVLASKRMQALGFEARSVIPSLRNIGDAAAALGMGSEGVQRIVTALGQMKAKGTVQAEEMRQLAEAGIPAWEILAKTLNTTVAEAMKQVEKRAVDAGTAVPAILAGINERFGGLMEKQSKTLLGQLSNMKDAIGFVLQDIGTAMAPSAKALMDNVLMPILNSVKGLAAAFAALPVPVAATITAMGGLAAALPVVILATGSLISNLSVISGWITKIGGVAKIAAVAFHPFTIVAVTVAALFDKIVAAWTELKKEWENDAFISTLRGHFVSMEQAMAANLERLRPLPPAFALVKTAAKGLAEELDKFKPTRFDESSLQLQQLRRDIDSARIAMALWYDDLASGELDAQLGNLETDIRLASEASFDLRGYVDGLGDSMVKASKDAADLDEALRKLPNSGRSSEIMREGWPATIKDIRKEMNEFEKHVRRVFDNVSRTIARNIVDMKGWKDSLIGIAKDLASGFLEIMIRQLLKPLENQFAKLAGKIGGWLGLGGSAASSAAGGAASAGGAAAGGAGSAAGGATSAVGSVAASWVGAIGSAVSAVSGVIGNFQFMGMNKSLDIIVKHTLQTANDLANLRADSWAREGHLMIKLDDLWNEIRNVVAAVRSGGGGSGQVTINIDMRGAAAGSSTPQSLESMFRAAFLQARAAQG